MATTDQVSAIQSKLANRSIWDVADICYSAEINGGTIANAGGVITIGGRSLSNAEYCRLGQVLGISW